MIEPTLVRSADDPTIAEFTALNDPAERRRVERRGGYFVVEGIVAIERLLATPMWDVRSLLLLPKVAERLGDRLELLDVPIHVAAEDVLNEIVGFPLHRGALASVTRVAPPPLNADVLVGLLDQARARPSERHRPLLVVTEGVNDHENLGALYRNAAALGAEAVLLDPTCADPFYRRSIRVSSGLVLALPTFAVDVIARTTDLLRTGGVIVVALTPSGDVDLRALTALVPPDAPVAVVVGAEGPGLSTEALRAADHRVAVEMAPDVDSLNVATAAAIALHHLR